MQAQDSVVAPAPVASWKRWVVLVGLATTQLMVVLDTMVMLIALPSLQSDLGISQDDGQWIITLYSLSYGGLLLLGGRVGDYNGRKRAFVIGLVGFVGASVLGGAAQDGMTLFAARALQGVFAALLVPAGLAAISVLFTEPKERARALAVYSAVGGSGLAIGMVLGGVLTEYTSWRWCLLVNVPIGVVVLAIILPLMTESRLTGRPRYDMAGATTVTLGVGALVYGSARAPEEGWTDPGTLAALAIAVVLLAAFVVIERRVEEPLLPLQLLNRMRMAACVTMLFMFGGLLGGYLFLVYYMQGILGYSALECGLALLVYAGAAIAGAVLLEQAIARLHPRITILFGTVVGTLAWAWFGFMGPDWGYWTHIAPPLTLLGGGMMIAYTAMNTAILKGATEEDAGVISAVINAAQNIGGALSPAILTTLAVEVTSRSAGSAPPGPGEFLDGYRAAALGAAALSLIACIVGAILIGRASQARKPAPLPDVPLELPHVAATTPLVTSPWHAGGSRTVHAEPEMTESVTTRITTRRTVDGEIVTVETTTTTRTVVETSVTERVTSRKEPAPHKRIPVSK